MKVFIAIPCMDALSAQFVQSLTNLLISPRKYDIEVGFQMSSLVYDSRNQLAERAINSNADYVFWLDSDMTFMPDTLHMMLLTLINNNLPMLAGVYYRRRPPFTPTLYKEVTISHMGVRCDNYPEDDIPKKELFEVEGCGFGCVLMRKDVLWNVMIQQNNDGLLFSPIKGVGEDLSFCWRARKCGYKITCDPTIALGHEIKTVITRSNRGKFNGNVVKTQTE